MAFAWIVGWIGRATKKFHHRLEIATGEEGLFISLENMEGREERVGKNGHQGYFPIIHRIHHIWNGLFCNELPIRMV
jgi:hypothetical protein